jgi:FixJ family two-component response regulator
LSGPEFLASLLNGLPECLIVDLQMAAMSGSELQQHLVRNGIHIPTIMITGHSDAGLHEQENTGLVAFLRKPLQDSFLLAAIDKAIGAAK